MYVYTQNSIQNYENFHIHKNTINTKPGGFLNFLIIFRVIGRPERVIGPYCVR